MNINAKLRQIMDDRGWTEYRLSKECGLSESTLANIFRRNTTPSFTTLETICSAFGITLSQFFAEGPFVELTPEQNELFSKWVTLTPKQKDAIYSVITAFESDK